MTGRGIPFPSCPQSAPSVLPASLSCPSRRFPITNVGDMFQRESRKKDLFSTFPNTLAFVPGMTRRGYFPGSMGG